eukprot:NODE_2773_length_743_cov_60.331412_g1950_i0.p2 GENE.NODE_2773_length_743_cov_60.331412_g1950_i0~~NODE_2773_length_743_cov_60.331412_g1950_i0.p2  ORF type:complete len:85 (-),score=10.74 NODE_2773_length_743_cov_60.331412_g1950_i0:16-270(-)
MVSRCNRSFACAGGLDTCFFGGGSGISDRRFPPLFSFFSSFRFSSHSVFFFSICLFVCLFVCFCVFFCVFFVVVLFYYYANGQQ